MQCVCSVTEEAGRAALAERKRPEDLTEEDKMALLGRPRLGDITRAQIRIKESKEFKVSIDLPLTNSISDSAPLYKLLVRHALLSDI